jgi:hypothetical protein
MRKHKLEWNNVGSDVAVWSTGGSSCFFVSISSTSCTMDMVMLNMIRSEKASQSDTYMNPMYTDM